MHITHSCTHLIVPLQAQGETSTPPVSSSCSSQQILHVLGSALASLAAAEDGPAVALSVLLMPNAGRCGLGKRICQREYAKPGTVASEWQRGLQDL